MLVIINIRVSVKGTVKSFSDRHQESCEPWRNIQRLAEHSKRPQRPLFTFRVEVKTTLTIIIIRGSKCWSRVLQKLLWKRVKGREDAETSLTLTPTEWAINLKYLFKYCRRVLCKKVESAGRFSNYCRGWLSIMLSSSRICLWGC